MGQAIIKLKVSFTMHIMTIEMVICYLVGMLKPRTGRIISNKVLASSLVHDIQIQTAWYILVKTSLQHLFFSVGFRGENGFPRKYLFKTPLNMST